MSASSEQTQRETYALETTASESQRSARDELAELFAASPLPREDLLFNLGLYVRSSLLVKFLVLNDVYSRIEGIPGAICEFGIWWGQNLVLLENLRAIREPFNKQRMLIGFDTFSGYRNVTGRDKPSSAWKEHSYSTSEGYQAYLQRLLAVHERSNVLGHVRDVHRLIAGDVTETAPKYFQGHPETIVALAYFDIALYEPTRAAMQAIKPHLIPGSVLLLDELTWPEAPGEAIAFREVFGNCTCRIEKCRYYPSKAIVTIEKLA